MKQVVIENPAISSPFEEPKWHFRFSDDNIANKMAESLRVSVYFIPVARPNDKVRMRGD